MLYKKDIKYSIISGLITGFVVWKLTAFLNIPEVFNISYSWLVPLTPVVWIVGVNFGYFLGRFYKPFHQFGRFAAVGFTNAAVDFGILNLLLFLTGASSGLLFSLFKATSFMMASLNSYIFNKYWTFDAANSGKGGSEFLQFFVVALLAIIVNVGVASIVVNLVEPVGGLGANEWANVGAVAGAAFALMFSFIGFRRVFKK